MIEKIIKQFEDANPKDIVKNPEYGSGQDTSYSINKGEFKFKLGNYSTDNFGTIYEIVVSRNRKHVETFSSLDDKVEKNY
ncbi:hypothetical protein M0R19_06565 [Candidatus Pacearchaeota archaeon]|jgi:hypothetical protein|nr:hypothetical protein [Candidatus Pacearchaeota archaeon]